jgi:hypothetical protein
MSSITKGDFKNLLTDRKKANLPNVSSISAHERTHRGGGSESARINTARPTVTNGMMSSQMNG